MAVLAMTVTSCRDDAGVLEPGNPVDIASKVAGTYNGTWTRVQDGTDKVESFDGSLTFTTVNIDDKHQYYIVNVKALCEGLKLDAQANANINPVGIFFNSVSTEFGNQFSGKIVDEKDATMEFKLTIKEAVNNISTTILSKARNNLTLLSIPRRSAGNT